MRYGSKWPLYARDWDRMSFTPGRDMEFETLAKFAIAHKSRYLAIAEKSGVPWPMIAVLHRRESNADFNTYLGNGERLDRVTKLVPKGRGPFSSFEDGAIDALKIDGLSSVYDWRIEKILYHCELFNGTGYDRRGLPSPYLWGGTNIQKKGKYVADGKFSPTMLDKQPGCAPILRAIARLDPGTEYIRES